MGRCWPVSARPTRSSTAWTRMLSRLVRAVALAGLLISTPAASARAQPEATSCADLSSVAAQVRPNSTGRPILFDQFIGPFSDGAGTRRSRLAGQDPDYWHRVDADLNAHRLNVALLGYGEEHDQTYEDVGVSATILTLNLDTWDVAGISLS